MKALYEKGFFNLKEAINFVAKKLSCSPTTIYRYVGKIEKKIEGKVLKNEKDTVVIYDVIICNIC